VDTAELQRTIFTQLPDSYDDILPCVKMLKPRLLPKDVPVEENADAQARALLDIKLPLEREKKQKHLAQLCHDSKRVWLLQHPFLSAPENLHCKERLLYLMNAFGLGAAKGVVVVEGGRDFYEHREFRSLSTDWLFAVPNAQLGQCLEPAYFRAVLCLRLLVPFLPEDIPCPAEGCPHRLDRFGYHAMACGKSMFCRVKRHERVADAVSHIARDAGYSPRRNAPVECLGEAHDGSLHYYKPADILMSGDNHQAVCVDVTIVSPLNESSVGKPEGKVPGKAAALAARGKLTKHAAGCSEAGRISSPFLLMCAAS